MNRKEKESEANKPTSGNLIKTVFKLSIVDVVASQSLHLPDLPNSDLMCAAAFLCC